MLKYSAGILLGLLIAGGISQAGIIGVDAFLNGANESPANASPGVGFAAVTVDTVLNTMRVQVTFSGLTSGVTASHIHCCFNINSAANTAGVATTTPTFAGFPSAVTSGTYDNTLDLTLASSYNPAFVTAVGSVANAEAALIAALSNGSAYLNIHTTNFGSGEIRGFLTPEPATTALIGAGLAGLMMLRRRRTV